MWVVHVVQVLCLAPLTCYGLIELVEYVRCVWLGAAWVGGVLIVFLCFGCGGVGGKGAWTRVWCYVCIICVDGRSRYLYIVIGGYLRILGAPSVQSC